MRILLDPGVLDFQNKGNISLLQVAVTRIRGLWPTATIGVLTRAPNLMRYYCPEANPVSLEDDSDWTVYRLNRSQKFLSRSIWRLLFELREEAKYYRYLLANHPINRSRMESKLIHQKLEIDADKEGENEMQSLTTKMNFLSSADLVVATGGGIICDIAKKYALPVLDRLEAAIRCGIPTAMLGQQIGPIQDQELLERAKSILPNVDIIAIRDRRAGLPLLEILGVDLGRVIVTGDDAIELAYNARKGERGNGIGIGLRDQWYMEIEDNDIETIKKVIHNAAPKYDAPLVSLPISYSFHEGDATVNRQILKGYSNVINSGRKRFGAPSEIIENTGNCRLVIAATYHTAVYALAQGIPIIGLAKSPTYMEKLLGLVDIFESGCEVINLKDDHLEDKLNSAIDKTWQSSETVKPQLLQAAERQIEWGYSAYQRLYGLV